MKFFLIIINVILSNGLILFGNNIMPIRSVNDVTEGAFLVRNEEGNSYKLIPTINTDVNIDIKGMVASSTVDQMFTNNSTKPIEAIYVFPLPPNAAVNNMTMIIDDRVIQGIMKEKSEAKKTYEKAKREGKRTTMTEQQRPNIFTNKVANIMPGDTIIVRLQYVNELKYENGNFNLRFPMVVAPRYISGSRVTGYSGTGWSYDTDIVPDASEITPHVTENGMRSGNTISLNVNLDAGLDINNIISSSHNIIKKKKSKGKYTIELKKEENIPNKDFTLEYMVKKGKEPKAALFVNENNDDKYFMLMAVPPVESTEKVNIDKEIIFIIDISGSMKGKSIEQAKKGLQYSVDQLNDNDLFNIIAYNDKFFPMSDSTISVNEKNILSASSFINGLNAGGGTRALEPLKHALMLKNTPDKLKMIVFITDGDLGYEKNVFNLVESHLGKSRLFSVGIGTAPNGHLLEKVSRKGRGTYTYINNINHVDEKMQKLLNKIDMPVLADIKLDLNGQAELYPNPLPDLFINEPLIVFGKISYNPPGNSDVDLNADFSGKTSTGYFKLEIPIKFTKGVENDAIGDLWARKKIDNLVDDWHLGEKSAKQKIIDLSIKHNLMSKFTSFVAVEEKIVNPSGQSILSDVHVDLPDGWDYNAIFGNNMVKNNISNAKSNYKYAALKQNHNQMLPRSATNMPTYLLFGFISLLISMILLFSQKLYAVKNN